MLSKVARLVIGLVIGLVARWPMIWTKAVLAGLLFSTASWAAGEAASTSKGAEWRALVIGVDAYVTLPKLKGAVNDANDIASTLKRAGVSDVTVLLDGTASRSRILAAWKGLVDRSAPGDRLLFSFAGHGAQEREWREGSEADGFDEVFMLAGFSADAPGNGERLRDDDISAMLRLAGDRQVVVLADSCHSGTLTRAVDGRVQRLGTRLVALPEIQNDVLRSNSAAGLPNNGEKAPRDAAPDLEQQSGVVYLGAARDGMVIPEVYFGKTPRGALSWSFARALEGRADLDRNGEINTEELTRFLSETVRISTEGRQLPSISIGSSAAGLVLPRSEKAAVPAGSEVLALAATTDAGRRALQRAVARHPTLLKLAAAQEADLIWDPETGDVLSPHGDIVSAEAAESAPDLLPIAAKWLLLSRLKLLSIERVPVELEMRPAVGHVAAGGKISLKLSAATPGNAVVFGLEADGTVRLLAPHPNWDRGELTMAPGVPYGLNLEAAAPFGVDHLVMVHGTQPMAPLAGLVAALDGRALEISMVEAIAATIGMVSKGLGIAPVYTRQR